MVGDHKTPYVRVCCAEGKMLMSWRRGVTSGCSLCFLFHAEAATGCAPPSQMRAKKIRKKIRSRSKTEKKQKVHFCPSFFRSSCTFLRFFHRFFVFVLAASELGEKKKKMEREETRVFDASDLTTFDARVRSATTKRVYTWTTLATTVPPHRRKYSAVRIPRGCVWRVTARCALCAGASEGGGRRRRKKIK